MHYPTLDPRSRQVRRAERRRRDKALSQAERRRRRAAAGAPPASPPVSFEEFCALAERLARPGDRLHVVECRGGCGRPVHAWLERGEETAAPSAAPKESP